MTSCLGVIKIKHIQLRIVTLVCKSFST